MLRLLPGRSFGGSLLCGLPPSGSFGGSPLSGRVGRSFGGSLLSGRSFGVSLLLGCSGIGGSLLLGFGVSLQLGSGIGRSLLSGRSFGVGLLLGCCYCGGVSLLLGCRGIGGSLLLGFGIGLLRGSGVATPVSRAPLSIGGAPEDSSDGKTRRENVSCCLTIESNVARQSSVRRKRVTAIAIATSIRAASAKVS